MGLSAEGEITKGPLATEKFALDCTNQLGEATIDAISSVAITLISGTSSTALTVENEIPIAIARSYEGCGGTDQEIAIGKGIEYDCGGGTVGCRYKIGFVYTTTDSETKQHYQFVEVKDE